MTADRDIERLLDTWFADGAMPVSDRAFDEAVGRVYRQRQRPAWRFLIWRLPTVSTSLKFALIGAALLAVLLGGTILFSGGGTGPGPAPTPTASPTPTVAPTPTPSPVPTARTSQMQVEGNSMTWTATAPATWSGASRTRLIASQGYAGPTGISVGASRAVNVPSDPCDGLGKASDGLSVADVVAMLKARSDLVVSNPTDTRFGGYPATRVDVEFPADLSACGNDLYLLFAEPDGSGAAALGPSNRFRVWIVDVGGRPIAFWISSFPGTPAADVADAQQIVDSIAIKP